MLPSANRIGAWVHQVVPCFSQLPAQCSTIRGRVTCQKPCRFTSGKHQNITDNAVGAVTSTAVTQPEQLTWEQSSPNNTSSAFYWHTSMLMNGKPCKGQYSEDHPLALTAMLDLIPLEIWKVPSSLS